MGETDGSRLEARVALPFLVTVIALLGIGGGTIASLAAVSVQVRHIVADTRPAIRALTDLRTADAAAVASEPRARASSLKASRDAAAAAETALARLPEVDPGDRAAIDAAQTSLEGALDRGDLEAATVARARIDRLISYEIDRRLEDGDALDRRTRRELFWVAAGCGLAVISGALAALTLALLARRAAQEFAASEARRRQDAEKQMRELDRFASTVAHDLRNPLSAIGLALQVAARSSPEAVAALHQVALRSIARLDTMIDDLLEFARSGGAPSHGVADAGEVLESVASELGPAASKQQVRVSVEVQRDAIAAVSETVLRSIVGNLLSNAIKYVGNPPRLVSASISLQGSFVVLRVADSGIGIPPDELGRIFEPFHRATTTAQGYGLGLATVKRLVQAHGGTMEVMSKAGIGSTFTVSLPRGQPPAVLRESRP